MSLRLSPLQYLTTKLSSLASSSCPVFSYNAHDAIHSYPLAPSFIHLPTHTNYIALQERDARLLLQTGTTHDLSLLITHNEALRADKMRLKAQLRTERARHADDLRAFQLDLQCLARTVEGLEREREANRVST